MQFQTLNFYTVYLKQNIYKACKKGSEKQLDIFLSGNSIMLFLYKFNRFKNFCFTVKMLSLSLMDIITNKLQDWQEEIKVIKHYTLTCLRNSEI